VSDWKADNSISPSATLTPLQSTILLEHIGVAPYMSQQRCTRGSGWNNGNSD